MGAMAKCAEAAQSGMGDRVGEIVYDYFLGGLKSNVVKHCSDAMTKDAIRAVWSTGVIRIEQDDSCYKPGSINHSVVVRNGDLVILFVGKGMTTNVDNIGSDLPENLGPVAGGLSLKAAQDGHAQGD